jgi:nicotinamidase-related amidase
MKMNGPDMASPLLDCAERTLERAARCVSRLACEMPELPLPAHFEPSRVGEVWRVRYEDRAREAPAWAERHGLGPAFDDTSRVCLLAVDVQNTFCIPEFELFVAGRSGTGAIDDSRRLCEFVYRNLGVITQIVPSLDTHHALQVFHAIWLVDEQGNHPAPYTLVSAEDVEAGRWRANPAVARALGIDADYLQRHLAHYTRQLAEGGKYDLTIWPYHAMLGGIGHALVSAVEEAFFFHGVARQSQPDFQVKGDNPLTEHYSMLGPEVTEGPDGDRLGGKNTKLIEKLLTFDAVVVAGQAKSHCMAWTIDDLLEDDDVRERRLAERTYLLEDCTSPVVVPGVVDYTDEADAAFERYAAAGMHVVRSTDPIASWPDLHERSAARREARSPT